MEVERLKIEREAALEAEMGGFDGTVDDYDRDCAGDEGSGEEEEEESEEEEEYVIGGAIAMGAAGYDEDDEEEEAEEEAAIGNGKGKGKAAVNGEAKRDGGVVGGGQAKKVRR